MTGACAIRSDWWLSLSDLVASARKQLTIVAPFISTEGTRAVVELLHPELKNSGVIHVLTDLSPSHVRDGVLQPEAISELMNEAGQSSLWHVPRLHAKVYVADQHRAIVTSGNLTRSAFHRNVEIGIDIGDPELLSAIDVELGELRVIGAPVGREQLMTYSRVAAEVRVAFQRQQERVEPRLQRAFADAVRNAEDELIRFRLAGGAMHTVFAQTILHLLRKRGAMTTVTLHQQIQSLHPDLCDDLVDRVIDGKSFGKKWKHAVRSAQQQLKQRGLVELVGDTWRAAT